jgi:hypothetical protein
MVWEPQVEDPCGVECVVKPIGTTVKKASKNEVEISFLYDVAPACMSNDARCYLV